MSPISERIEKIMKAEKLTPAGFAYKLGYDKPEKIYRLFRKDGANPSVDILNDISNVFVNYSMDWLITGQEPMLKRKGAYAPLEESFSPNVAEPGPVIRMLQESHQAVLNTATAAIKAAEAVESKMKQVTSSIQHLEKNVELDQTMINGLTDFVVKRFAKIENVKEREVRADLGSTLEAQAAKRKKNRSSATGS